MSNATHYDIAIIGAGAAGLSAGYFLAPERHVLVLERESQPAYHSSGRSAAMYIEGYEGPVVAQLTRMGREFYYQPPQGFTDHKLLSPAGTMIVAGPNEQALLKQYMDTWQPLCPELIQLDADASCAKVPILRPEWVQASAYDPTCQHIDVHELLSGFQRGIRANEGSLQTNAEVLDLTYDVGQWSIATAAGTFTADLIINAAGAWANHVAALAAIEALPLTPMRRTAAIIAAPEHSQQWPLVHTMSENLYFKPESSGLMISPQDETPVEAMDAFPLDLDIAIAADRFQTIASHPIEHVLHSWAGLRTFATDRVPVVGLDQQAPAFFWLAGQGGFGIQTAPGLAAHVADMILNQETIMAPLDVNRYR